MNSRALYWMAKAIVEAISWVGFVLAALLVGLFSDAGGLVVLAIVVFLAGLAWWAAGDMSTAMRKLKAEANRDTVLGRNGPAFGPVTKGDLL